MTLFAEDYTLELTEDEWLVFSRPVRGAGGAQVLLRHLHRHVVGPRGLRVDYVLLDRCYQYAYRYADGGFQDRFRAVVKAALRTAWTPSEQEAPRRRTAGAFGHRRTI